MRVVCVVRDRLRTRAACDRRGLDRRGPVPGERRPSRKNRVSKLDERTERGRQDARIVAKRTVFSGEPMDQSALTRTSRLTATACGSRTRDWGWGVGQSPRRDARGGATRDFSVAGEITRHCRDAVFPSTRARHVAYLLGGEGLLRARELGADGGGGGDGLHGFRATGKCRAVRVLLWPERARSRCFHPPSLLAPSRALPKLVSHSSTRIPLVSRTFRVTVS